MLSELLDEYVVDEYNFTNVGSKSTILNNFPIYVINLNTDSFRRNYIKCLFKKHGINYKLIVVNKFTYNANRDNTKYQIHCSKLGCILSHLWCIRNAVENNYEQFIVFEDDIIFHKNFEQMFSNILLNNSVPDLLMLGAIDFGIKRNMEYLDDKREIYYPKTNVIGAHANMYKLEFAKAFLKHKLESNKIVEFDYDYHLFLNNFKIGICFPNIVVCELTTTNINHLFSPLETNGFNRYKNSFPPEFTYNNYEYINIMFLKHIHKCFKENNIITSFDDCIRLFTKRYVNRIYIHEMAEWLYNSGYDLDDLKSIVENIDNDSI